MNPTLRLKQDILKFLSNQNFDKSEFKQIYQSFTLQYSEYESKKYYQKIYQIIRELGNLKCLIVDQSGCTYRYSTIVNSQIILEMLGSNYDKDSVQRRLLSDYHKANSKLHKIKAELEIFNKYVSLYPKIEGKISTFTNERTRNLLKLESELSAIDIILENI